MTSTTRPPLTRERVLRTAVGLADRDGLPAVTMRGLAAELGVEAMSLYHHVRGKEALLDGLADTVVEEAALAAEEGPAGEGAAGDWHAVLRARVLRARRVMLAHPWAPAVIETRTTMSPPVLRYFEGLAAVMRGGGCSVDLVHHAMHALGSRALGFSRELFDTSGGAPMEAAEAEAMVARMGGAFPHIAEVVTQIVHDATTTLGWCDDQEEFEFGLDLMLDGLVARQRAEGRPGPAGGVG